ncbi:hypothetical protein GCM10028811_23770 [Uliginosibacterium sediminicola]
MKICKMSVVLGALLSALAMPAQAGIFADDLARCMVRTTTEADRHAMLRWLISSISVHPVLKSMITVSAEQSKAANQDAALLMERLLTVSCKAEAQQALRSEGGDVLGYSFGQLGQIAGRELSNDPAVAQKMQEYMQVVDAKKIQEALAPEEKR